MVHHVIAIVARKDLHVIASVVRMDLRVIAIAVRMDLHAIANRGPADLALLPLVLPARRSPELCCLA